MFSDSWGESTAQMLKVMHIYSAKIITAGRQQATEPGRSPPCSSQLGLGPATFPEHRCRPRCPPCCSASLCRAGTTHTLGSAARPCGTGTRLCRGEDAGAGPIKSWEVGSDPITYSLGKVARLCLITLHGDFSCFPCRYIFRFYPRAFNFLTGLSSCDRCTDIFPFSSSHFNLSSALLRSEKRLRVAVKLRGLLALLVSM